MGTVELLLFFPPRIFFEPVKNVPAPKVILRLRPRVQNLVPCLCGHIHGACTIFDIFCEITGHTLVTGVCKEVVGDVSQDKKCRDQQGKTQETPPWDIRAGKPQKPEEEMDRKRAITEK